MKKVFFIAILAVMSTFNAFSSENNSTAKVFVEQPQCVSVANVSGQLEISGDKACPYFNNYNDFPVNVSWKVYAYNEKGDRCTVASGTTYVNPVQKNPMSSSGKSTGYAKGYTFPTSGYSGFSLEMNVTRCD